MSQKRYMGFPNAFGGQDIVDESGQTVARGEADVWGNTIYTKPDGSLAGFGTKDFSGGETITRPDGTIAGFSTAPFFDGGSDFFLDNNDDN